MNEKNYLLSLTRLELIDLMIACTSIEWNSREEADDPDCDEYRKKVLAGTIKKWVGLHDKIKTQLDRQDALYY